MKNKFYRIISPASALFTIVLDIAVIWYAVFAVKKIMQDISVYSVVFLLIEIIALAVGVLVTKEVFTQGVVFKDDCLEFTALDSDNVFYYADIEKTEIEKDKKASLKKNFNDRHSYIIFYLNDDKMTTVDLGLTTFKTLKKLEKEINSRIKS